MAGINHLRRIALAHLFVARHAGNSQQILIADPACRIDVASIWADLNHSIPCVRSMLVPSPPCHAGSHEYGRSVTAIRAVLRQPKGLAQSSFGEWGEVFSDSVIATALLDRPLHHAVVVQIEGSSFRLRAHADLLPDIYVTVRPP
ncbi:MULTISPECIES: ATP-binding protein [Burkholderia cepacia complex]|uniref:ATP-binding protein n=1 Tax=Burkholderia cepacia complex TaxID=87882 RepID=UPI000B21F748|nr:MULTISPECIES: ATP-binding protein [Burkholderia cepacia complex]